MGLLGRIHGGHVHGRRVRVLTRHLSSLIPSHARVLDVGCGDGLLTSLIAQERPDVSVKGVDVLVREGTRIPVDAFDGRTLPYEAKAFDATLLIDVLHHTEDPMILLREVARVSRRYILIKDHLRKGLLAGPVLRFMDWVGNARHHVALPNNYWAQEQWDKAFSELGVRLSAWESRLGLYPRPASWIFERQLHFVAQLEVP
jgi:SAM-dependent methyltransferase